MRDNKQPISAIETNAGPRISANYLLLGLGLTLLTLGWLGLYPGATLLSKLSGGGSLATEGILQSAQQAAGTALLASGVLLFFFPKRLLNKTVLWLDSTSVPVVMVLFFLTGFALSLLVQLLVFNNMPHITDATSHVFQARIFSGGAIATDIPACYEAFFQHNVIINPNGLWHTKYFPGQALWLTPGFVLGLHWLMMPMGWGLICAGMFYLAQRVAGRTTGLLTGLFVTTSPLGLLISASFMSHTTVILFAVGGISFLSGAHACRHKARRVLLIFAAGVSLGMGCLTRPQDMVILAASILIMLPFLATTERSHVLRSIPWLISGALIPAAILMIWNNTLYGAPLASGYNFEKSISLTPIIKDSIGFSSDYPLQKALKYMAICLTRMDATITGWTGGLALGVAGLILLRPNRWDIASLILLSGTVGLYTLFPYYGFELEARYYSLAIPAVLYLTARALIAISGMLRNRFINAHFIQGLIVAGLIYTLLFTWREYLLPKYANMYEHMDPSIHALATEKQADLHKNMLVMIKSTPKLDFLYSSGFAHMDPFLNASVIYARWNPEETSCIKSNFPDRTIFLYDPDHPDQLQPEIE